MKLIIGTRFTLACACTLVRSDMIDEAEAKKRGVPVEVILQERKAATIKPEVTPPASQPATLAASTLPELEQFLEIPIEFRGNADDTTLQAQDKKKAYRLWLQKNVLNQRVQTTVTVNDVLEDRVLGEDKNSGRAIECLVSAADCRRQTRRSFSSLIKNKQ